MTENNERILSFRVSKELTESEIRHVSGGGFMPSTWKTITHSTNTFPRTTDSSLYADWEED